MKSKMVFSHVASLYMSRRHPLLVASARQAPGLGLGLGVPVSAFAAQTRTKATSVPRRQRRLRLFSTKPSRPYHEKEQQLVQDMLYRIRQISSVPHDIKSTLVPFKVDGVVLGKVTPTMAQTLCTADSKVFCQETDNDLGSPTRTYLTLSKETGSTVQSRSNAVQSVALKLKEQGIVTGWRDELYPIASSFYEEPVFLMERAAVGLLGVMEYGVHLNGLVGDDKMWIARRSATKSKYPRMLDHIVAGGQPAGLGLMDNVIKECLEEAGIPEKLTRAGIQPAGAISYETYSESKDMLSSVVLFAYDLHLPESFQPKVVDGEVEHFYLWTMDQLKESMAQDCKDPIKPNCYVVIIDFLLRTGQISPEVPGYLDILRELRSGQCQ